VTPVTPVSPVTPVTPVTRAPPGAESERTERASSESEQDWLERALAGDVRARERLVREHWQLVHRLLLRILGHRADIEDLAHAQQVLAGWPAAVRNGTARASRQAAS